MKNLLWLILGLLLGVILGVGYAWVLHPGEFRGSTPGSLKPEYRGEYLMLIATAYDATGNLERARGRLAAFPEIDARQLGALAQQVVAMHGSESAARGFARLSVELAALTPTGFATRAPGTTLSTQTPFLTPTPTAQMLLTITLPSFPTAWTKTPPATTATTVAGYSLVSKEQLCTGKDAPPSIRVLVHSANGQGIAGVIFTVRWPGGEGRMVTGMMPEIDPGFADYEIQPKIAYQLILEDNLMVIKDLLAPECPSAPSGYPGSWLLTFISS